MWRKNQQKVIIGHVRVPIDSVPDSGEDRGHRVIVTLTRVQGGEDRGHLEIRRGDTVTVSVPSPLTHSGQHSQYNDITAFM